MANRAKAHCRIVELNKECNTKVSLSYQKHCTYLEDLIKYENFANYRRNVSNLGKKAIVGSMWINGDLDLVACTCTLHIREYAFALAVCKTTGIFAALD